MGKRRNKRERTQVRAIIRTKPKLGHNGSIGTNHVPKPRTNRKKHIIKRHLYFLPFDGMGVRHWLFCECNKWQLLIGWHQKNSHLGILHGGPVNDVLLLWKVFCWHGNKVEVDGIYFLFFYLFLFLFIFLEVFLSFLWHTTSLLPSPPSPFSSMYSTLHTSVPPCGEGALSTDPWKFVV